MSGPSKESMERAREWIVESGLFQKLDHFKFLSSLALSYDEVRAEEWEAAASLDLKMVSAEVEEIAAAIREGKQ